MERDMARLQSQLEYVRRVFIRDDPLLDALQADMQRDGLPGWEIEPENRRVLEILVKALDARRIVEIGTLGGYSAIAMARMMPPDGELITIEANARYAAFAQRWVERAGLADIVQVRVGRALDVLPQIVERGPFDLCFIDADKANELEYLDWALENVRVGGMIVAHNAFGYGTLPDALWHGLSSAGITHAFNRRLADSPRTLATILPVGDGMAVAVLIR